MSSIERANGVGAGGGFAGAKTPHFCESVTICHAATARFFSPSPLVDLPWSL